MWRSLTVGLVMLSATASAQQFESPQTAGWIKDAKAAVIEQLSDPDSAKFRKVFAFHVLNTYGKQVDIVCGEVNSKTVYGGFSGFHGFVYLPDKGKAHVTDGDPISMGTALWEGWCEQFY